MVIRFLGLTSTDFKDRFPETFLGENKNYMDKSEKKCILNLRQYFNLWLLKGGI